ncbi:hypothetical protein [Glutamicibacter creatinolyticus]|uniref:hypothetical protein n=1 Tax=Glutamicibacter creatinolyticus TaxID=162496 RepID=UPI0032172B53
MTVRLNPEALDRQALEAAAKAIAGKHWLTALDDARAAVSAFLAVALPAPRTVTNLLSAPHRTTTGAVSDAGNMGVPTPDTAPRTITTVEELEALPHGVIVLDADDGALMLSPDGEGGADWVRFYDPGRYDANAVDLPARVLWVPTEGCGE